MPIRAIIFPLILLAYLIVMIALGYPSYKSGDTSPLLYFGGSVVCLFCIVALHFHLKRTTKRHR